MPNLKIFATVVFMVTVLVMGLEYLPKFYAQPASVEAVTQTIEAKMALESPENREAKVLQAKEESKQTHIGYTVVGYFLLLSVLLYIKILMQRTQRVE
jgi:hypothetical protein